MKKQNLHNEITGIPRMPKRKADSHKGDFGRVLCVCGSLGMAGAAYLCAKAAYRVGAGLVEIFTCKENRTVLQMLIPEAIVTVYDPSALDLAHIREAVGRSDSVVVGCGLGRSEASKRVFEEVLESSTVPTVIDADALNIISENKYLISKAQGAIITPHLREMERLSGFPVSEISKDVPSVATRYAIENSLVCALKCHRTSVADASGKIYINNGGNSGMATGGSGDVLAGVIGGILAQNKSGELSSFDAAVLGVYLHSKAGDLAAEDIKLGEYSMMASDIIDKIGSAIESML